MYTRPCPRCGTEKHPLINVRDRSMTCDNCGFSIDIPTETIANLFCKEWNYAVTHSNETENN